MSIQIRLAFALACSLMAQPGVAGMRVSATLSPATDTQTPQEPLQPPRLWQHLPPTETQARFALAEPRVEISSPTGRLKAQAVTEQCRDVRSLATLGPAAVVNQLATLPDSACTHGLFRLPPEQAIAIYSQANMQRVARRFVLETRSNNGGLALINLTLYLRAGYYLAAYGKAPSPDTALRQVLRPAITQLLSGSALYSAAMMDASTGAEVMRLISNMRDEGHYLDLLKLQVQRLSNSPEHPAAALALRETGASQTFTGLLTVFYHAHMRPDAIGRLRSDPGIALALNRFALANRASLIDTHMAYQLGDAVRESLRFLQYPALRPILKPLAKSLLASSSMTGPDNELWLATVAAIRYYDREHCADYGVCNAEVRLAEAILPQKHACGPGLRIRSQEMTAAQMQSTCVSLRKDEAYFHRMLQTHRQPLVNDLNHSLEIVVFNDYNNYSKYAPLIFGVRTDNGGIYAEGNPAASGNQARFIAHEASWLRPRFRVWNLEHEYIHYLDGRFDMYGDFDQSTAFPTAWWTEGLAEYLSLRNRNQAAIDAAKTGSYLLSVIFNNRYGADADAIRIYRWSYMAIRFMFEKHRADVDLILSRFRAGNYAGYIRFIEQIGTRYDAEFARWVQSATTTVPPPLPGGGGLPPCQEAEAGLLAKDCMISDLSSSSEIHASLWLPLGARNLRLWTSGGRGDVDLYLAAGRHPSASNFDHASATGGNNEFIRLPSPETGRWYYLTLVAKHPFLGVSISAGYD